MIPRYDILNGKLLSLTDNKGNIYFNFTTRDFLYNQIYKLDISRFYNSINVTGKTGSLLTLM